VCLDRKFQGTLSVQVEVMVCVDGSARPLFVSSMTKA
jgi:hypothetical protein